MRYLRSSLAIVGPALCLGALAACGDRGQTRADDALAREAARAPVLHAVRDLAVTDDFGSIADLEVDGSGRVYVADAMTQQIRAYSENGARAGVVGRRGSGPGEFRGLRDLAIRGDTLYALDAGAQRVSAFALGRGLRPEPVYTLGVGRPGELANYELIVPPGGGILAQYTVPTTEGNLEASKKVVVRRIGLSAPARPVLTYAERQFLTLRHPRFGFAVSTMPYGRVTTLKMAPDGRLFLTRNDSLALDVYDSRGKRTGGFRRVRPAASLAAGEVDALIASYPDDRMGRASRELIELASREDRIPRHRPAFGTALVDDKGRMWVDPLRDGDHMEYSTSGLRYARARAPDGTVPWWVLDEHGAVIRTAALPAGLSPRVIRGGSIYGTETDSDGVERVARYRLEER